jgi:hypothetical protein
VSYDLEEERLPELMAPSPLGAGRDTGCSGVGGECSTVIELDEEKSSPSAAARMSRREEMTVPSPSKRGSGGIPHLFRGPFKPKAPSTSPFSGRNTGRDTGDSSYTEQSPRFTQLTTSGHL